MLARNSYIDTTKVWDRLWSNLEKVQEFEYLGNALS